LYLPKWLLTKYFAEVSEEASLRSAGRASWEVQPTYEIVRKAAVGRRTGTCLVASTQLKISQLVMKNFSILAAALLGLASTTAMAQAPVVGSTTQVPTTTPISGAGTVVPGQPNSPVGAGTSGTITTGVGIPIGTGTGSVGSPNSMPAGAGTTTTGTLNEGAVNNGTLRGTQSARNTRSTRRTTNSRTTTTTRP